MARRTMITAAVAVLWVLCFSTADASVTVSGYAFLADEEDHRDIVVLFEAASPSAVTDSTYTDSTGYFQIAVEVGMYTITYSKEHHLPETLPTRMISEDTVLEDVTLPYSVHISGDLSGTLTSGGIYIVTGDIYVQSGDTLIIEPGVTVKFDGPYAFGINGLLRAVGTEADSILFTSNQPTPRPGDWIGIQFNDSADDSSRVEYCGIEHAQTGIYCSSSSPTITHNTIMENTGHGIYCSFSSATITHNTITGNSSQGIYSHWGLPRPSPTIPSRGIARKAFIATTLPRPSPTIPSRGIALTVFLAPTLPRPSPTIPSRGITREAFIAPPLPRPSPTIPSRGIVTAFIAAPLPRPSPTTSS